MNRECFPVRRGSRAVARLLSGVIAMRNTFGSILGGLPFWVSFQPAIARDTLPGYYQDYI